MIFTESHYIAQVARCYPAFGLTERATGLNFIKSPVKRGSRRTSERVAITGPFKNVRNSVSSLTWRCVVVHRCALASIRAFGPISNRRLGKTRFHMRQHGDLPGQSEIADSRVKFSGSLSQVSKHIETEDATNRREPVSLPFEVIKTCRV